ncbi:hypothetical protein AB0K60_12755 [Thermopolyspora sp. NPDC052614]|uniref:hypothetical protein n=1 Tax=Thermopolyspora sp. NPDC052614 TaxID=3155682 RepID=UPI003414B582
MATDAWTAVKQRFARLLGRGDPEQVEAAERRLERSRQELAGRSGGELEQARAEQVAAWKARLTDLLEDHPACATELRELIEAVRAEAAPCGTTVVQHVVASDRAQQAVLGQGTQNVVFHSGDD